MYKTSNEICLNTNHYETIIIPTDIIIVSNENAIKCNKTKVIK